MVRGAPVYFTDENTLGLGKLLRRQGRNDVLYPGHEGLPEVPLGAHQTSRTRSRPPARRPLGLVGREKGPDLTGSDGVVPPTRGPSAARSRQAWQRPVGTFPDNARSAAPATTSPSRGGASHIASTPLRHHTHAGPERRSIPDRPEQGQSTRASSTPLSDSVLVVALTSRVGLPPAPIHL